jgi:hypothetical protein
MLMGHLRSVACVYVPHSDLTGVQQYVSTFSKRCAHEQEQEQHRNAKRLHKQFLSLGFHHGTVRVKKLRRYRAFIPLAKFFADRRGPHPVFLLSVPMEFSPTPSVRDSLT